MNIAAQIQFIPLSSASPMNEVDRAIEVIAQSGLSYEVGPFGTSVEGNAAQIHEIIEKLVQTSTKTEFLLQVQYHVGPDRLSNSEKVAKFR